MHRVEERTFDTMQSVVETVPRTCTQFYSDGLATYPTLIYYGAALEAHADKSQTYSVEGSNAEIRHYDTALLRQAAPKEPVLLP